MSESSEIGSEHFEALDTAVRDLLIPLLEECARGRNGLFGQSDHGGDESGGAPWPEAEQVRALALTVQSTLAQSGEHNAFCDEFLDLCTIHGENDPGEPRLARSFLARIECGEVGTNPVAEKKKW
jgi:hypothetical protein